MLRVHKIRLDPNLAQADHLARAGGTSRFAYNWALAEWTRQYEACKLDYELPKPGGNALAKQLNTIKREQFPWMLEVTVLAVRPKEIAWRTLITLGCSGFNAHALLFCEAMKSNKDQIVTAPSSTILRVRNHV